MVAPDGFVYVKVKLGVSDSDYTQVVSGLTAQDTVGYDPSSVSSDTYYDNGGYEYMTDGTTDTTGGETTDGTADGEGAESTVTEDEHHRLSGRAYPRGVPAQRPGRG